MAPETRHHKVGRPRLLPLRRCAEHPPPPRLLAPPPRPPARCVHLNRSRERRTTMAQTWGTPPLRLRYPLSHSRIPSGYLDVAKTAQSRGFFPPPILFLCSRELPAPNHHRTHPLSNTAKQQKKTKKNKRRLRKKLGGSLQRHIL